MTTAGFTESVVEEAALAWLEGLGYAVRHGPDIAPGEPAAERDRLRRGGPGAAPARGARAASTPTLPAEALDDAFRKLTRPDGAVARSRATAPSTACSSTA